MYFGLEGINIGSGQHYADGWLNTDIIPTDKGRQPDMLIDIHDFLDTFEKHQFKKAYVGHVLEHHPKQVTALLAAVLLGGGGGAFAVASFGPDAADVPVLYGGSVKADNAAALEMSPGT